MINETNIFIVSIYFSVRHCLEHTWINDRDQFFYPSSDNYKKDKEFQKNCLVFMLFHGQNRISSNDGINHWIPFSAKEVGAKTNFKSDFMGIFIKDLKFSREAKAVLKVGLELWKYYHKKTKTNRKAIVNASFYDIREFFQGRNEKGTMKIKSEDETYNTLIADLRLRMKTLAQKIEPKIYEYGFLKE